MKVQYGNGSTEFGPGVDILLSGDEVATAIDAYLVAHGIHADGPRTILIDGKLCAPTRVYVDPSGFVIAGGKKYPGMGPESLPPPEVPVYDWTR